MLTSRPQRLPTRGENGDVRTLLENALSQRSYCLDHRVAAVQNQQRLAFLQMRQQSRTRVFGRHHETECGGYCAGHKARITQWSQVNETDRMELLSQSVRG